MPKPLKDKKVKDHKTRIHEKKWKSLEKRGIHPPANAAEAKQRLKEAHGY